MVNGYEDGAQTGRSILLSTSELAELLRGDTTKGEKDKNKPSEPFQPVVELEKLLAVCIMKTFKFKYFLSETYLCLFLFHYYLYSLHKYGKKKKNENFYFARNIFFIIILGIRK